MSALFRVSTALACALVSVSAASAATPKEIEAAIKKGTEALKARYSKGGAGPVSYHDAAYGVGPACLAGVAMLEGGVTPSDPVMKALADAIRTESYNQTKTYQVSLCLLFLDRHGDPADVPLIQILAVRLLAGQTNVGGWGYECIQPVSGEELNFLKQIKAVKQASPKMYPEVERYAQSLASARSVNGDDNSNTQFGVIGIWLSRKHGVPVDRALDAIEQRFLNSQNSQGGWAYSGPPPGGGPSMGISGLETSSPSMYCAGLIGLATSIARREERRQKAEASKPKEEPAKATTAGNDPKKNPDDPFFAPPPKAPGPDPKKNPPAKPLDSKDRAKNGGFAGLAVILSRSVQEGRGGLALKSGRTAHGVDDLYFFWSLERACVIYGVETIGGVNWYEAGATTLVAAQRGDGTWLGNYAIEADTSFAVLFLCKANLARDLSGAMNKTTDTEMRAGAGSSASTEGRTTGPATSSATESVVPAPSLPGVANSEPATMAAELVRSKDKEWEKLLTRLRDTRGEAFTEALVTATTRLEGQRLKDARQALADRLTRMTADTLRGMAKSEEAELRRAAVLAMGQREDKKHIPDLIDALLDEQDFVVRAARASLKSLSGEDFGPRPNANKGEQKLAVDDWLKWWNKQKK